MVSAILERARGYLALGIPHEALEELCELPAEWTMRGEVLTLLALIALAQESPERAADFAALAVEREPWRLDAREAAALACERTGRLEDALGFLDSAPAAAPKDAQYVFREGNILLRLGREREARARFRRALLLDARASNPFFGGALQECG